MRSRRTFLGLAGAVGASALAGCSSEPEIDAALGPPASSLEEAARLDGASPWQTFWRIMFPLSGPALSAVAILTALASWNDLMWPLIVATYDDRTTLAVGLSTLQGQFTTDYPVMMAAAFMAMLPLMILFIVLQRRVVEGLAHSGMKG